ncbi:MAG: hypothetical protein LBQ82_09580 [Treponema sp.]|nr:hypothetical protein [Treponema sp.]
MKKALLIFAVFSLLLAGCENPLMEKILGKDKNEGEQTGWEPEIAPIPPENLPPAKRWSTWEADDSTATIAHSVAIDGVCTIIVGGTPMTGDPSSSFVWKVNASYAYTAVKDKTYVYTFDAWTEDSAGRTMTVQWYNDNENRIYQNTGYNYIDSETDQPKFPITSTPITYTIKPGDYGCGPIPKSGVQQLEFQCANQTGTFYVKIISIKENDGSEQVDINEGMNGTLTAPFKVYNKATLQRVGTETGNSGWTLGAYYELVADIDLSASTENWTPIGHTTTGSPPFTGTFNGNGYTITDLTITDFSEIGSEQGMFGTIGVGGTVKNLALVRCAINARGDVGGVAGKNFGTVISCSVSGSIIGSGSVGGVVGYNEGTVSNCYSTGTISGDSDVGGIVGNNQVEVENCYSTSTVSGGGNIGGVVGNNEGTVSNCYSTGTVSGDSCVGGIVGENHLLTKNCVALNLSVSADSFIGRVVGLNNSNGLINNYAWSDMPFLPTDATANGKDGKDVSSDDYKSESWWRNASNWSSDGAWNFTDVWIWDDYAKLPKLRNVGGQ